MFYEVCSLYSALNSVEKHESLGGKDQERNKITNYPFWICKFTKYYSVTKINIKDITFYTTQLHISQKEVKNERQKLTHS